MATVLLFQVDPRTQVLFQQEQDVAISVIRCDESNQVLTHLTAGTIRPEVVVLGSQLEQPAVVAEHIHAVDKDVTILILSAPDKATAIQNAIQASLFLGSETICLPSGEGAELGPILREAIVRTQRLRSYHSLVASTQQRMATAGPAPVQSNQYLDRLLDCAPIGVVLIDQAGVILAWNRYAELLFGVLEHEVMGTRFHQHLPESVVEPFTAFIRQSEATQNQVASESFAIQRRDGSEGWVKVTATPIAHHTSAKNILLILQDISEIKQAEELLRASEQRLNQLMEALPVGVFLLSSTGTPLYANQTAQELLGQGILPQTTSDHLVEVYQAYLAGTDQEYPVDQMPIVQALSGESTTVENMEIRRAGANILLSVSARPIWDATGNILYAVAVFSDITQRKIAEVEQNRLQQELIRLQETTLAELSTPLIPLTAHSIVIPLVGAMNDHRAHQVLDALLHGVSESGAHVAIIDITGVPIIDSQVASVLIQAAQATRLLGAEVILTGIRPEVAQTLVGLGIDLKGIVTLSTLEKGIHYAMRRT